MDVTFNSEQFTELIEALLNDKGRELTELNIRERVGAIKEQLAKPAQERPTEDVQSRQMTEIAVLNSYAVIAMIKQIKHLKTEVDLIKGDAFNTGAGAPNQKRQQRISESRGVASLKMFTGDKKEFNE